METNKSSVLSLFTKMDEERQAKQKRARGPEKRLTVVLSDYDYRRLKYIANHFEELPSVFARNLLLESLKDAEKFLNLTEIDEDSLFWVGDTPEYEFTEYGKYVNGLVDDLVSDSDDDDTENELSPLKPVRIKLKAPEKNSKQGGELN